jgi:hypothetical protein
MAVRTVAVFRNHSDMELHAYRGHRLLHSEFVATMHFMGRRRQLIDRDHIPSDSQLIPLLFEGRSVYLMMNFHAMFE